MPGILRIYYTRMKYIRNIIIVSDDYNAVYVCVDLIYVKTKNSENKNWEILSLIDRLLVIYEIVDAGVNCAGVLDMIVHTYYACMINVQPMYHMDVWTMYGGCMSDVCNEMYNRCTNDVWKQMRERCFNDVLEMYGKQMYKRCMNVMYRRCMRDV